jgi:hypothetical protein
MRFGRSSEALDAQIEQLELRLEDLEETEAARVAAFTASTPSLATAQSSASHRRAVRI